jgi:hypothetical protein
VNSVTNLQVLLKYGSRSSAEQLLAFKRRPYTTCSYTFIAHVGMCRLIGLFGRLYVTHLEVIVSKREESQVPLSRLFKILHRP